MRLLLAAMESLEPLLLSIANLQDPIGSSLTFGQWTPGITMDHGSKIFQVLVKSDQNISKTCFVCVLQSEVSVVSLRVLSHL